MSEVIEVAELFELELELPNDRIQAERFWNRVLQSHALHTLPACQGLAIEVRDLFRGR